MTLTSLSTRAAGRWTPTSCDRWTSRFSPDGGLRVLRGGLGQAVTKVSAAAAAHRVVRAPAVVFDNQAGVVAAFERVELDRDPGGRPRGAGLAADHPPRP
jgi:phosphogluconate dehydratase